MAYTTTSLTVLRTLLASRYDSQPFWSTTEATDAINEALRQFNLYTGYWRGSDTVATVANGVFLTVPSALTYRSRVTRTGKVLTRKSIVGFYRGHPSWRTETTASGGGVPTAVREWAPVGLLSIAIWPADAAGGTTLTVEGVKKTPILVNGTDVIDIGEEEIGVVLDEALWVLAFKRPSVIEVLSPRHQAFLAACLERNDQLRASSYYRTVLGLDQQQRLRPSKQAKDEDPLAAGQG